MTSIRNFAYAALLAFTALNLRAQPGFSPGACQRQVHTHTRSSLGECETSRGRL